MKKIIILIIIVFLSSGCFNYKEINDYAIVSGISIDINDEKNDEYMISIQIMNSKKEKEDQASLITIYKASGKTIYQALEKIMLDSPKEIYLGHNEVVVISEELLKKKDPLEYLDYFLRDSKIEKDSLVINAKNNKAYEVLEIITPLETIPSTNLKSSLNIADNYSGTLTLVTIDEFIQDLKTEGIDPVLPTIIIKGKKDDGDKMKNIEESNPNAKLKFTTLAYFKNNKLSGYLTSEESLGYNFLKGEARKTYINVLCDDKNYMTLRVNNSKISNLLSFKNKKPNINVKLDLNVNISEYNCNTNFIDDEKVIKKLEKKSEKKVIKVMMKLTNKLYKNEKADVLGYGYMFYSKKYKEMEKYNYNKNNIINKLTFNFKSNIKIESPNLTIKSIKENNNE